MLVQNRRDTQAAKRLLRKLVKKQMQLPRVMITDKLGSYGAAKRQFMPGVEHGRCRRTKKVVDPAPDQRTHIFAETHGKRTSFSLRLQMQRRRQGHRNPKRDPPWAPGRFRSFGSASSTFVLLHTLYIYCT